MHKSLDGLRALAVLSVMAFHYGIFSAGWMGVQFFFVLSGFLISSNLLSYKENTIPVKEKFLRFFQNRTLRIFPVYYFYLLIVVVLNYFFLKETDIYEKAPYLFTYTFNLIRANNNWVGNTLVEHLWSLSIEEQFYLFWPFLILLFSRKQIKYVCVSLLFLIPLFRLFYFNHLDKLSIQMPHIGISIYYHTICQIDAFIAGCCIALFQLLAKQFNYLRVMLMSVALFLVLGFINYYSAHHVLDLYYFSSLGYKIGEIYNGQFVWSYAVINLMSVSIIIFSILYKSDAVLFRIYDTILNSKWMKEIGKVSYGMYVFHWLVMSIFTSHNFFGVNKIILFPIYAAMVFGAAWLSYVLIESKFLKYKYSFSK